MGEQSSHQTGVTLSCSKACAVLLRCYCWATGVLQGDRGVDHVTKEAYTERTHCAVRCRLAWRRLWICHFPCRRRCAHAVQQLLLARAGHGVESETDPVSGGVMESARAARSRIGQQDS